MATLVMETFIELGHGGECDAEIRYEWSPPVPAITTGPPDRWAPAEGGVEGIVEIRLCIGAPASASAGPGWIIIDPRVLGADQLARLEQQCAEIAEEIDER